MWLLYGVAVGGGERRKGRREGKVNIEQGVSGAINVGSQVGSVTGRECVSPNEVIRRITLCMNYIHHVDAFLYTITCTYTHSSLTFTHTHIYNNINKNLIAEHANIYMSRKCIHEYVYIHRIHAKHEHVIRCRYLKTKNTLFFMKFRLYSSIFRVKGSQVMRQVTSGNYPLHLLVMPLPSPSLLPPPIPIPVISLPLTWCSGYLFLSLFFIC